MMNDLYDLAQAARRVEAAHIDVFECYPVLTRHGMVDLDAVLDADTGEVLW